MTHRIALLRAVNVGGKTTVSMAALRDVLARLGLDDVKTLLQSGNVVFSGGAEPPALEDAICAELKRALGLDSDVLIRERDEWQAMIDANPYPDAAASDPSHLLVFALKSEPKPEPIERLRAAIVGRETVEARGRALFIVYPDGIGRSKLTNTLIEKTLGIRGTGRNWNTVTKLAALLGA